MSAFKGLNVLLSMNLSTLMVSEFSLSDLSSTYSCIPGVD